MSSPDERNKLLERLLYGIEGAETKHGKYLDHPTIKHGLMAGDTAFGNYALMPKTAVELVKHSSDPVFKDIKHLPKDKQVEAIKADQGLQKRLAIEYISKAYEKQGHDEDATIASYLMGPNRSPEATHELMDRIPNVQKYVDTAHREMDSKFRSPATEQPEKFENTMKHLNPNPVAPKVPPMGIQDTELPAEDDLEKELMKQANEDQGDDLQLELPKKGPLLALDPEEEEEDEQA